MKNRSTTKTTVYALILIMFGSVVALGFGEAIARLTEDTQQRHGSYRTIPDPILGWIPKPNTVGGTRTREYDATYRINELAMNDAPVTSDDTRTHRILVIGDSHTFALGVGMEQSWPNRMESVINQHSDNRVIVYNGGVIGYSLGQYLKRLEVLAPKLDVQTIIIGFSMATDLYDLIPPQRGGFIYGGNTPRVYYDLDKSGQLVEKNSVGRSTVQKTNDSAAPSFSVRGFAQRFALYRVLKRSKVAFWIAAHFQPGGKSLWPGLDTALKKELSADDEYRWRLAEKIIARIGEYAKFRNQQIFLVNIPYLAQVYDDVWAASFGHLPKKYDREIGGRRLEKICARYDIEYIDTTDEFIQVNRKTGEWLHFRHDGHPTPAGHELIAHTVVSKGFKRYLKQSEN